MFIKTKTISTQIWAVGREWLSERASEFGERIDYAIIALVHFDVIMGLSRQAFPVTDHENISFSGHKVNSNELPLKVSWKIKFQSYSKLFIRKWKQSSRKRSHIITMSISQVCTLIIRCIFIILLLYIHIWLWITIYRIMELHNQNSGAASSDIEIHQSNDGVAWIELLRSMNGITWESYLWRSIIELWRNPAPPENVRLGGDEVILGPMKIYRVITVTSHERYGISDHRLPEC